MNISTVTTNEVSEGATTGSAVANANARPRAVARAPKALMGPLKELAPKHQLLIDYMLHGAPERIAKQVIVRWTDDMDVEHSRPRLAFEPLKLDEAAFVLGIRKRHAKHLMGQTVFQRAYAKGLEAMRDGAKADALRRVIALVDEAGEGKAADRKVQLQAAQAILGEQVGTPANKPQAVNVNVGLQLSAGVVVRLPPGVEAPPLEGQTIDATAIAQAPDPTTDQDDDEPE